VKEFLRPEKKISGFSKEKKWCRDYMESLMALKSPRRKRIDLKRVGLAT
jgi:hypothetical protein